jgi:chaperonin GroES
VPTAAIYAAIYIVLETRAEPSAKLVLLELKAGDRVLFGKWSSAEVKNDGEDLLIMKERDVMRVIDGASATKKKAA